MRKKTAVKVKEKVEEAIENNVNIIAVVAVLFSVVVFWCVIYFLYRDISWEEITNKIEPMLREIKKFGGVFGLLWHNENFSENNMHNGLAVFENIMRQLVELKTTFRTGEQISQQFKDRLKQQL